MPPILRTLPVVAALVAAAFVPAIATAQGPALTQPPSGGNQKASVTQHIGLVEVRIDYSSPDVTGPNGQDRRGQIWGALVPYGLTNLGFGNGNPGPWRAGANENTVFTVSHDVEVQGQPLPAGTYGLHMIVEGEGDWTLIFSRNSSSWGSFFYDESEDALRVAATPREAPFTEWLSYEFVDRQSDHATAVLRWEELEVPFTVSVPDPTGLYIAAMRDELRSAVGFSWQNWNAAAQYCLQNNRNLEEALTWAETSISTPFVGQANFTTLQTKADILTALGRSEEAAATMRTAFELPSTTPIQIHAYARQLQAAGDLDGAIEVFEFNGERWGDAWPVHVGLARAASARGDYSDALVHARKAREQAPDTLNQDNLDQVIELLEQGRDFNVSN